MATFDIIASSRLRQAQKCSFYENRLFGSDSVEPQRNPRWPPKSLIFSISQDFVVQTYKCDTPLILFFQGESVSAS